MKGLSLGTQERRFFNYSLELFQWKCQMNTPFHVCL